MVDEVTDVVVVVNEVDVDEVVFVDDVEVVVGAGVVDDVDEVNECNAPRCGPDPLTDSQATGILLNAAAAGTTVTGNSVAANDIGIYNFAEGATTLSGNTLTGNRFEGVVLDQGDATVDSNTVDPGNVGILVVSFNAGPLRTADSKGTLTCNQISRATEAGIRLLVEAGSMFTAVASATNNSITGNAVGLDNTIATGPAVDARQNWWGCPAGPENGGCNTVNGPVDTSSPLPAPPACPPPTTTTTTSTTTTIAVTTTTTTPTTTTTLPSTVIPGGKNKKSDCYVFADVEGTHPVKNPKTLECADGDPTCDLDGKCNNVCVLQVRLCINSATLPPCTPPSQLTTLKFKSHPASFALNTPSAGHGAAVQRVPRHQPTREGQQEGQEEHRCIQGERDCEGAEGYEAEERQRYLHHEVRAGLRTILMGAAAKPWTGAGSCPGPSPV